MMIDASIHNFSRLYRRTVSGSGVSGEAMRVQLSRIKPQRIRVLSHVSVENRTSDYTKCRLGISNGGIDHYLDELITVAAEELAVSKSDILLGQSDVFFAELTGTTDNDIIVMTCVGWELDL